MTLVFIQAPGYYKIFRSAVEKTMAEDYISIIQATGIRRSKLFAQFVLKNSILPIITVAGLNIAFSISGVTMTEIVFSWQGMGRLLMDAIGRRDHLVLLGAYLIISICVCVFTILTDILYALVNPQVRYQ
jgi:peptide/nickel transport system permease protein